MIEAEKKCYPARKSKGNEIGLYEGRKAAACAENGM